MAEQTNNKTIAKNTMFLYFRMMVTMIISLYTSRVILQVLGVNDYGIYQAVGGMVGLLSFVNNSLSIGSSRFITYALGEGNFEKLKKVFSTTLTCHIILAILIALVAETAGLWFFHNKMVIPPDRQIAAEWVYHFSIITALFTLTQVPFNACIIAHEKMTIYAYLSIIDAVCKLFIVYMLTIGQMDRLILYAFLIFLLQVSLVFFYCIYCFRNFHESRFQIYIDKKIFQEIVGFSGWNLFANSAIALNNQGILILLNMFFSPAVVAARSISIQVEMAAFHFVTNFQTAAVPQIVKRYAQNDYEGSKLLLLEMMKYSFCLMLLLALPIFFSAENLLQLWLGIVPPYTVIFLQLIIIQSLIQVFDTSLYKALYAKGQLRQNALLSPTCLFINFPLVYILFKLGFSPVALSCTTIICYSIMGLIIKPILVTKLLNYTWGDIFSVVICCFRVIMVSIPIPLVVFLLIQDIKLPIPLSFILIVSTSFCSAAFSVWYLGLTTEMRSKLVVFIRNQLKITPKS